MELLQHMTPPRAERLRGYLKGQETTRTTVWPCSVAQILAQVQLSVSIYNHAEVYFNLMASTAPFFG